MRFIGCLRFGIDARPHTKPWLVAALLAAVLALAACGESADQSSNQVPDQTAGKMTSPSNDPGGPGGPGAGETQIPEGAIPVGDEIYMVPIGRDKDGCEQFTGWSPSKPVAQVIFYRDRKGGFTADRSEADCGKG